MKDFLNMLKIPLGIVSAAVSLFGSLWFMTNGFYLSFVIALMMSINSIVILLASISGDGCPKATLNSKKEIMLVMIGELTVGLFFVYQNFYNKIPLFINCEIGFSLLYFVYVAIVDRSQILFHKD